MKRILIIEDDYFSAKRLERLILDYDDTIDIHGPLVSTTEVVEELTARNDYDLIFSDIRLADGDVFAAFRKVRPNALVIFTTAFDEYAMQAIKNNGIDYLLKPIDSQELNAAFKKLELTKPDCKQNGMSKLLDDTFRYRERILVTKGDELIVLHTDEINYFRVDETRVLAFTDDASYPLSMSMAELEAELNPDKFFRINKQYIVSINGIRRICFSFGSRLVIRLKNCTDDNVCVSKKRTTQFKAWLDR